MLFRENVRRGIAEANDKNFKNAIEWNGPIREISDGFFSLCFCSKQMSKSLVKLGCVQKKSMILKFPKINKKYINHFIRGYFDGDGCISGKGNNFQFTIVSTEEFCNELNRILGKIIGIKKLENHPNNTITKRYRVGGRKQVNRLYKFLYKNSTVFLNRKKNKMEELLCIS